MQKKIKNCLFLCFFLVLVSVMLLFPKDAFFCASNGLHLWFQNMVPTLFPFMVLSGLLIRLNLSKSFAGFFRPVLAPVLRMDDTCLYVVIIGFLCGFPMGAKVCGDMYRLRKLSKEKAEYLLSFCNHIGPIFFTGIVLPLLPKNIPIIAWLFGMYGIPLCYGLLLRLTKYKNLFLCSDSSSCSAPCLSICSEDRKNPPILSIALEQSVSSALESIAKLGGYMIFFNLLLLIPRICTMYIPFFDGKLFVLTTLFLEITSGIHQAGKEYWYLLLPFMQFGGISCIAQTMSMIAGTDMSVKKYVGHKFVQMLLCSFYMCFLYQL